jgi:hypothetical protein
VPYIAKVWESRYLQLRSAVALRPAKSRMFDRATRDIIRDRETSRFQVVVEGQLQMAEENGLDV